MFDSLLVANRGEIACRVIRAARALGVRTIAVYSEADSGAAHVRLADEAYALGPAPAVESYLCGDKILEIARLSGAAVIHPGYGFLAENANFAASCAAAGLIFVGPRAQTIRALGVKDSAKACAAAAGVPVVPGYYGADQSPGELQSQADAIGYPVLLKAVAGGGGKGLRRVDDAGDFPAALEAVKRESLSAFGDARVMLEKYIVEARHIEVQIFCDSQGHGVHLFERDCSLQRRHQKVIEEAPAPGVSQALRKAIGAAALSIAKAVDYEGAGTVEFLVDSSADFKQDAFYFMEMNTRLQVEHMVTEMITGIDLVEWQLRIAAGEALPCTQKDIVLDGHAVEARLYAEDPKNEFLPSTGRLEHMRFPEENKFLRVETGIGQGDEVTIYYDPMIAKLVAWGPSRAGAVRRLQQALEGVQIAGPLHNVAFLRRILDHADFTDAHVNTRFIDAHLQELVESDAVQERIAMILAALYRVLARRAQTHSPSPWNDISGWRLYDQGTERFYLENGAHVVIKYKRDGTFEMSGEGWQEFVSGMLLPDDQLAAVIGGVPHQAAVNRKGMRVDVMWKGGTYVFVLRDPLEVSDSSPQSGNLVVAPMPGKISSLLVGEGESVLRGAPLLVMEAMKMEHTLKAPCAGKISDVAWREGAQVSEGDILVRLEEEN